MTQSFQCISCGNQNAFGEPVCTKCGQPFIYNCPICGSHINNHYERCHGCGTAFYWDTLTQANVQENTSPTATDESHAYLSDQRQIKTPADFTLPPTLSQPPTPNEISGKAFGSQQLSQSKGSSIFSSPRIWVTLIIICVVLMGLLLLVDWFINK